MTFHPPPRRRRLRSDLGQAQAILGARDILQLPLVNPALDADLPVGCARLGEAIVDVGAQRVQGQLPLEVPLRAGDLGPAETPRHANLDALAAEPDGRLDR